jgi:hypothetical protein
MGPTARERRMGPTARGGPGRQLALAPALID